MSKSIKLSSPGHLNQGNTRLTSVQFVNLVLMSEIRVGHKICHRRIRNRKHQNDEMKQINDRSLVIKKERPNSSEKLENLEVGDILAWRGGELLIPAMGH